MTVSFDPEHRARARAKEEEVFLGDRRAEYVYEPEILAAIRVALAVNRPLLLFGEPGSGKTSLAEDAALVLGWDFYAETVGSRSEAAELFWRFDAVRRLADAQVNQLGADEKYLEKRAFWRAFDPAPLLREAASDAQTGAVVLVDEIDKADPDLPNDLLEVLSRGRFTVRETGREVLAQRPLFVVITSNSERDLPRAFVRRCVVAKLDTTGRARQEKIVRRHFPQAPAELLGPVLDRFEQLAQEAARQNVRAPSVAELLDAVRACGDGAGEARRWQELADYALWKHPELKRPDWAT